MNLWLALIDLLRASLFAVAHVTGGSMGAAILVVSTIIRVALLPLTLRTARRAREHQAVLRALEPELTRIRQRYAADRSRVFKETTALYEKHGIGFLPRGALPSMLAQAPIFGALYQAIAAGARKVGGFLWIRDLGTPDLAIAIIAAVFAAAAAKVDSSSAASSRAWLVGAAITLLFAWRLTAGVGLYWIASNAVGLGQAFVLRRDASP